MIVGSLALSQSLHPKAAGLFRRIILRFSSPLLRCPRVMATTASSTAPLSAEPFDITQRVPVDLMRNVLDHLPSSQLLPLAGVSKHLRAVVKRDMRFRVPLRLKITSRLNTLTFFAKVVAVDEVLQYAVPEELPVSFTLSFGEKPTRDELQLFIPSVFKCIERALPILVDLDVEIPDKFSRELHAALRHPAPRLRGLRLSRTDLRGRALEELRHILPSDIFQGVAPLLSRVGLENVSAGEQAIPAFADVRHAELSYDISLPRVCVTRTFPCLKHLELDLSTDPSAVTVVCSGLMLDSLRITDMTYGSTLFDAVNDNLDFSKIPVLVFAHWYALLERAMKGLDGPISLALIFAPGSNPKDKDYVATIVALDSGFQRGLRFCDINRLLQDPFEAFHALADRLVDIRLNYYILSDILEFQCDLPVLRRLRFELVVDEDFDDELWFPDDDDEAADDEDLGSDEYLLRCPVLERVVFLNKYHDSDIAPRQVACIGRAFGQLERQPQARAQLLMVGVHFDSEGRRTLVDEVFPRIVYSDYDSDHNTQSQDLDLV